VRWTPLPPVAVPCSRLTPPAHDGLRTIDIAFKRESQFGLFVPMSAFVIGRSGQALSGHPRLRCPGDILALICQSLSTEISDVIQRRARVNRVFRNESLFNQASEPDTIG
jgi:hypothetical protein